MSNLKFAFLLIIALCIGWVSCSPLEETNGQRLARGLPPKPPRFLSTTPTLNARGASTSPLPSVTLTGRLQVRNPDGSVLGNVRNWATPGTISGVNFLGPDQDLLVKLTFKPSHPTKIDVLATNPTFPAPFYVGAGSASNAGVPKLSHGSRNTVGFTNVPLTPGGARPTKFPALDVYVESAIWTLDQETGKLTAQWINVDGSKPPTIIAYDIRENSIFFVGDITAYNQDNDLPASTADLFLVPV
ncbi:hypothetical protein GALMADRAFT_135847 [Galerina marginata CBS 339.88]|uniref:Uncharacterized protein n=1 Tax=Galerina marginata (strain CBS 339.88) TaxID=685588 RepID=A0A067TEE2_GALM3|nr:hypothetical protein GALMADRAFT_135847 [Galerina marginata CBS 339.88]